MNWFLFSLRTVLATVLAFLLLGPIIRQIQNEYEKPHFVVIHDNSSSVRQASDTNQLATVQRVLSEAQQSLESNGYSSLTLDLRGAAETPIRYNADRSDLHSALKLVSNRFEGQNIGGVVLVSDGIYNSGLSPLFSTFNFPVYTVGVGDTTERIDAAIKNIAHNKIVYQGNKFPVRAELQLKNLPAGSVNVSLLRKGRVLDKQTKKVKGGNEFLAVDFQPMAEDQGIQKYDVQVEVVGGEQNTRNNRASVFIEVVEGKKKILLVAAAPHPDIKAIREVIQKNANYEFLLHIPGVQEQQQSTLRPDQVDLAIFHQSPDLRGRTASLFQSFATSRTSLFLILGQQSDLMGLAKLDMPVKYESMPREYDEVTAVANPAFPNFALTTEANTAIGSYPPSFVHFGKFQVPPTSATVLYQRVGSVTTEKPLLFVDVTDNRKVGVLLGEGLWRWRLNEFERNENTDGFDELFGKLIQFLSTTDEKKKFRSYPLQQEFSDTESVVFESQVYNDIFEPVYGNKIDIDITDEQGKKSDYTYVTSPGNIRYQIGGLKEGVYRYRSRTTIDNKTEEVRGEFAVIEQQAELQNLTADHELLRKLSENTGGKFYRSAEINKLKDDLQQRKAQAIIHSAESYDSVINLKWVFFLLVFIVTIEWVLRKYHGSY